MTGMKSGCKLMTYGRYCMITAISTDVLKLFHTIPTIHIPKKKLYENIVGKGENAGNQHFFPTIPQCFLLIQVQNSFYESHLFCRLQSISNRTGLKFCRSVKS